MAVGKREADDIKPECVISSGYDPVKSEETDNEDTTSNLHENHLPINIKEKVVKAEIKTEDDVSTDDEQYKLENVISSSGYDPVKSEETDDDELGEDINTNTSNEQHLPIKEEYEEVKTEDDVSTDDEYSSEVERTKKTMEVTLLIGKPYHNSIYNEKKKRRCSKRKRDIKEKNGYVQKTVRIECSVEGCTRKAADSGKCKTKHGGRYLCKHERCTTKVQKGGVCIQHGAKRVRKICKHEECTNYSQKEGVCVRHGGYKTCSHQGCSNQAVRKGVCSKHHGAVVKKKTCSHDGCTNQVKKGGFCIKHGAVKKITTCKHEGCANGRVKGGFCRRHYKLSNGESVTV